VRLEDENEFLNKLGLFSSAPERDFLPSVEDYFDCAVAEMNPANQVEDQYKKVNDGPWGWRALRLMAKRSPHFFTYGNQPIAKLHDYLESMLKKMTKDFNFPSYVQAGEGAEAANGSAPVPTAALTAVVLAKIGTRLAANWQKLAPKLGLDKDAVCAIEKEKQEDKDRATLMLEKWVNAEKEAASPDELVFQLTKIGWTQQEADSIMLDGKLSSETTPDVKKESAATVEVKKEPELKKEIDATLEVKKEKPASPEVKEAASNQQKSPMKRATSKNVTSSPLPKKSKKD